MNERTIKDVMQRALITCQPNATLEMVARRLNDYRVHALVVTDDDGYAVGIISQTDLLLAHYRSSTIDTTKLAAADIMTSMVITCTLETTIFEAVTTMTRHHIHRLVIVKSQTAQLYPLGLVSMTDIIRFLITEKDAPALAAGLPG
jgi:CBS domain-containing protein